MLNLSSLGSHLGQVFPLRERGEGCGEGYEGSSRAYPPSVSSIKVVN